MELSELAQIRLIAMIVVLAVLICWALAGASARRRLTRFSSLARSVGAKVAKEGEFLYRFSIELDGRVFDIRHQHIGGRSGAGGWAPDWYLVTATRLRNVSDLHCADIRPRGRPTTLLESSPTAFERHFSVRDTGYPLRNGWLTEHTRSGISEFYALDLPLEPLAIEEATLVHQSRHLLRRLQAVDLRELLIRQAAVASALEAAL